MNKNNNIYKILSLCLVLSISQYAYCASNELVKMNLDQTTDGTVKVNIYTDKPYSDKVVVKVNPKFYRPAEVELLIGDCSKAEKKLGWKRKVDFEQLVKLMVENDLRLLEK